MARNKRLHVELAIIKLNFLQQAIELSTENGQIIKKKRLDGPVAFRTKTISSLQVKTVPDQTSPKLLIQEEKKTSVRSVTSNPTVQATPPTKPAAIKPATPTTGGPKKSLLDALREKVGDQYAI